MGHFTLETGIDIDIFDIINNLDNFNTTELTVLKNEITKNTQNSISIQSTTLDEYYKVKILKEFFDKYSWEELEQIKKIINKYGLQ